MMEPNSDILLDLTFLRLPFCGIQSDAIAITQMLLSGQCENRLSFLGGSTNSSPIFGVSRNNFESQITKMAKMSSIDEGVEDSVLKVVKRFDTLVSSFLLCMLHNFKTQPITDPLLKKSFFRFYFSRNRWQQPNIEKILSKKFILSNLSQDILIKNVLLKTWCFSMNTAGYKLFFTHQDHAPLKVSKDTKYVIRYHDSIPILHSDLMHHPFMSMKYRHRAIKKSVQLGAYFVCNSEQTEKELHMMFPASEGRTRVIPPSIYPFKNVQSHQQLKSILETKSVRELTTKKSAIVFSRQEMLVEKVRMQALEDICSDSAEYVLTMAPLEPKKNISNLIKACHSLHYKRKKKLKLIIVGGEGWRNNDIKKTLIPAIQAGEVVWLQRLYLDELQIVLSHARSFAFVSFVEGFGMPPLEAMSVGIPVVSSDIPVHRWAQRDAALYCNPHDYKDIAAKIDTLVDPNNESLREELITKGKKVARLYSKEVLSEKWDSLFQEWSC